VVTKKSVLILHSSRL